jgi:hypothetical protein
MILFIIVFTIFIYLFLMIRGFFQAISTTSDEEKINNYLKKIQENRWF